MKSAWYHVNCFEKMHQYSGCVEKFVVRKYWNSSSFRLNQSSSIKLELFLETFGANFHKSPFLFFLYVFHYCRRIFRMVGFKNLSEFDQNLLKAAFNKQEESKIKRKSTKVDHKMAKKAKVNQFGKEEKMKRLEVGSKLLFQKMQY